MGDDFIVVSFFFFEHTECYLIDCFGLFSRRSLFSPSGQGAGQTFGQQGVYNNMSITVSMAGGSGGAGSLPPMAQAVGNSNLNSVIPVCSDQQVSQSRGSGNLNTPAPYSVEAPACVCAADLPGVWRKCKK